ncbi:MULTISPECIES: DUF4870 domain-containing protein [Ensifer]|jgi:uncharacterized membrane protein|uniref:DUF4870 domain-containing protein n=1 Tax=Ensifer canadensis TaxID=555315 RepID=A0AAW4FFR2_9HYPH|nr:MULTISPECIES: DUF4870 domain-containing protein [Ensifer]MDP9628287.1 putative membrane protein [Ensifer adhaerens]KQU71723.1 hypothetical protein ASD00_16625 [Ensifer sp. Root31]KQW62649.1 hypothetical protein ASD02_00510 [Ensifer sp. Root1252]KQW84765.1 hypothetical protein ASD03_03255 [Ensifer sp. Root127]KQY71516.1 hypothetical protein ASD52_07585 [Ensifer sp. Root142]
MSDNGPQAPPPRETDRWLEPGKVNVQVIYVLYLVAFAVGITSVIGVVLAYLNRGKGAPWVQTHYTWAIRTFWIALLFGLISALLMVLLIGFLGFIATAVWIVVRCVVGLQRAAREEPISNPESWMI